LALGDPFEVCPHQLESVLAQRHRGTFLIWNCSLPLPKRIKPQLCKTARSCYSERAVKPRPASDA
jgi:hypothetical protein